MNAPSQFHGLPGPRLGASTVASMTVAVVCWPMATKWAISSSESGSEKHWLKKKRRNPKPIAMPVLAIEHEPALVAVEGLVECFE